MSTGYNSKDAQEKEKLARHQHQSNEQLRDNLAQFLADNQVLRVKTQGFHWNIEGAQFFSLHEAFESQYQQLGVAIDEIAEQMRILGWQAPASMAQYLALASIDDSAVATSAIEMVSVLADGHAKISRLASAVQKIAVELHNEATADLMIKRIQEHNKTAWMLHSFGSGSSA